ncbi:MAG: ABC transporter substrate-binding protein [Variibacter sp.]|nr:ABC transporter substrate-binding protein [Variibacter sp.]
MKLSRRNLLASAGAAFVAPLAAPMVRAQNNFLEPTRIRMGYAPYISAGPYLIAEAKGYFKKLGITIEATSHVDGSLSMPALAAGELDITGATISAGMFNLMAKGTPVSLFMERGREEPGMGSNAILVNNDLAAKGFKGPEGYRLAKGQKIAISSRGSVAHYLHAHALAKAGLTVDDVDWGWGMTPQVSLPLLQQNRVGIVNLPLPGAYAAQNRGVGKVATWSDEIAPGFVLACSMAHDKFLAEKHSAAVRFCMAIMQGNKEYMEASKTGDPEILKILAEGTRLTPDVIDSTRPRWTFMVADGLPNLASIMEQQKYWHEKTDLLVRSVPEERLFRLAAVKEAWQRYNDKNPFI